MRPIPHLAVTLALTAAVGAGGYYLGHHRASESVPSAHATEAQRRILYWTDPMIPGYRSDKPGKSPMGMDLIPIYAGQTSAAAAGADVTIAPNVVDNLGVRTAEVLQGTLSRRIDTVGYVGYDEDTITSINTRAEGWVEKLGVKSAGDRVRAGQVLYQLFSPKLATAEREYLTALVSGSRGLIEASEQRLESLGFTAAQVRRLRQTRAVEDRVARHAGSDGVVTELGIREGAYVVPMTQVMRLADLRNVWVLAEVDESQAAAVKSGQDVEARFDAFPDRIWRGVVDYIYPDLSRITRTVKLRVRIPNPDQRLQPNMFAHIRMLAAPGRDVLYIPAQALIRTGTSQRVIVALGDGRFDVCPVEAGYQSGAEVQILKGLWSGARVVVSAQFMIDSEANVDAAALRLGAGKPGCTQAPTTPGRGVSGKGTPGDSIRGDSAGRPPGRGGVTAMPAQSLDAKAQQP
ncbi:MAG: efflux RND transporter periplasmic adaptor subunit [Gammaproteobacteria bacterium]|nr:efflux RND transporter periplasmic adaptor subunit [Gammaproteobacteria bacterium]